MRNAAIVLVLLFVALGIFWALFAATSAQM
jgi:hypothetical protein